MAILYGNTAIWILLQTIKENDFNWIGNDWVDKIHESTRLNDSLLSYNENFKIIAEYNLVKNLDWGGKSTQIDPLIPV